MMNYVTPFERAFMDMFRPAPADVMSAKSDLRDTGDAYVLEAELPGFKKEEITLDVEGDVLTITAQHTEKTEEEKAKEGTYLRRERTSCSYSQKLDISGVELDRLSASYENGVLTLNMPKKGVQVPASKRIEIQ